MKSRAISAFAAAAGGFVLSAALFASRPARAQFTGPSQALPPITSAAGVNASPAPPPQPIQVQAMDSSHFVVVTREPRLVQQIGREGSVTNMLLTVVTYYTVSGDRLVPVEHVRLPAGFQQVTLAGG